MSFSLISVSHFIAAKVNLENELVRHFLIEPCKQGVRLKGNNNEPAFPSLVALIFQHSVTKMALPIELVLPTDGKKTFMKHPLVFVIVSKLRVNRLGNG